MAIAAFIPSIWSARFLDRLVANMVWGSLVNRDYEGEVSAAGDTVKIPSATTSITVSDYIDGTNLAAPQRVAGSTQDLSIDQQKYFHFKVTDLERVQNRPELVDVNMQIAAEAVATVADTFLQGIFNGGWDTERIVTSANAADATDAAKFQAVIELKTLMSNANVPPNGRWMVVPPHFVESIEKHLIAAGGAAAGVFAPATADDTLRAGFSGRLLGFDLYESTRFPQDGTGAAATDRIIASYGNVAVTYADQITEVEAIRDPDDFADRIRGLYVYGAKLVHSARIFGIELDDPASS